jgi:hypothetical protein
VRIIKWLVIGFIGLTVLGAIIGPDDEPSRPAADVETTDAPASKPPATTQPETTTTPPAPPPKRTARERLDAALPSGAESSVIGRVVEVTVPTPEGGFEGASTKDLDRQAADVFHAIYGEAGYTRKAIVFFQGGLVSTRTGEDLDDVNTGIYEMEPEDGAAIDWDDEDVWRYTIDYATFRTFAHPALKQD